MRWNNGHQCFRKIDNSIESFLTSPCFLKCPFVIWKLEASISWSHKIYRMTKSLCDKRTTIIFVWYMCLKIFLEDLTLLAEIRDMLCNGWNVKSFLYKGRGEESSTAIDATNKRKELLCRVYTSVLQGLPCHVEYRTQLTAFRNAPQPQERISNTKRPSKLRTLWCLPLWRVFWMHVTSQNMTSLASVLIV